MPFIQIKVFEDELSADQKQEVIGKITDVVASIVGENLRPAMWGVGGKALTLDDVKAIAGGKG